MPVQPAPVQPARCSRPANAAGHRFGPGSPAANFVVSAAAGPWLGTVTTWWPSGALDPITGCPRTATCPPLRQYLSSSAASSALSLWSSRRAEREPAMTIESTRCAAKAATASRSSPETLPGWPEGPFCAAHARHPGNPGQWRRNKGPQYRGRSGRSGRSDPSWTWPTPSLRICPKVFAACLTRSAMVWPGFRAEPFRTRDAVAGDTPASRATSVGCSQPQHLLVNGVGPIGGDGIVAVATTPGKRLPTALSPMHTVLAAQRAGGPSATGIHRSVKLHLTGSG